MSNAYIYVRVSKILGELKEIIKYEFDENEYLMEKLDDLRSGMGTWFEEY